MGHLPTPETPNLSAYPEAPTTNRSKKPKQDHLKDMTVMLRGWMDHLANVNNHLSTMSPILE